MYLLSTVCNVDTEASLNKRQGKALRLMAVWGQIVHTHEYTHRACALLQELLESKKANYFQTVDRVNGI